MASAGSIGDREVKAVDFCSPLIRTYTAGQAMLVGLALLSLATMVAVLVAAGGGCSFSAIPLVGGALNSPAAIGVALTISFILSAVFFAGFYALKEKKAQVKHKAAQNAITAAKHQQAQKDKMGKLEAENQQLKSEATALNNTISQHNNTISQHEAEIRKLKSEVATLKNAKEVAVAEFGAQMRKGFIKAADLNRQQAEVIDFKEGQIQSLQRDIQRYRASIVTLQKENMNLKLRGSLVSLRRYPPIEVGNALRPYGAMPLPMRG